MQPKPKVSPNDTYIFDDDDLDLLDEFSLSSILDETALDDEAGEPPLADFEETMDSLEDSLIDSLDDPFEDSLDATLSEAVDPVSGRRSPAEPDREPTIDELLAGPPVKREEEVDPDTADTGTFAALEVLLPPEAMFPVDRDDDQDE